MNTIRPRSSARRRNLQFAICSLHFSIPQDARARGCRRGISLIEMLVVIAVASTMVGLTVTTIHRLLGAEREATRAARYSASVARLARHFRDDLHAARAVEWPAVEAGKPAALVAALEGQRRIRYEVEAHRVTRLETDGAGEMHRDAYYFPLQSRLVFEPAGEPGLIRLTIAMPAGVPAAKPGDSAGASQPLHLLTIEAAVAREKSNRG
jgi:prepilin-type N-terminal cleavage/methylation domain-containing protein